MVGRAATIEVTTATEDEPEPYRGIVNAIDAIAEGAVVVIRSGGFDSCGLWGELFSTAASRRGGSGTLLDGYTRDSAKILRMGYPVFSRGSRPIDMRTRARYVQAGVPVEVEGVVISPGDLIFGDRDGVVAIPREIEKHIVDAALYKVGIEREVADELRDGATMHEVWVRHGVL